MPRAFRNRGQAAVALNATCVSCHDEEASAWRGSRHRAAYTNTAFQEALAIEPSSFCRGCHAPEAHPGKPAPKPLADIGVACVTCHVTEEGQVLAAARAGEGAEGDGGAPHRIRRSAAFAMTGACSGCHEFPFPGAHGGDDPELMQTTLREHGRSPAADRACADCHMPVREGRRSHAFAMVRDPGWLKRNLIVSAARGDEGQVRITLSQREPGHAYPTGDLFRRLEVGCEIVDAGGKVLGGDVKHLARHFEVVPGRPNRQLVRDDRVFDEPRVVELTPSPAPPEGATLRWWVTYQRVATVGLGKDPRAAKIESEVALHSGEMR